MQAKNPHMNTPNKHVLSEKRLHLAKLCTITGAIFSLLGIAAGFYFGIIRPAVSSGRAHELPMHSILMGIALSTVLIFVGGFYLWRWFRGPKKPPSKQDGEEW